MSQSSSDYDVLVLGAGPGGYVAAIRAAQLGMKVAVVEKQKLGGVCLNWGCIPTKALLKSAEVFNHFKHAKDYGLSLSDPAFDFNAVITRSRKVANRMSAGVKYLFKKNNIVWLNGEGVLLAADKVQVTSDDKTEEYTATNIIIATGARARPLPGVEFDNQRIIDARGAMSQSELPESLIIIGAGAIGIEFAYFYHSLGTKVTVLEMMHQILPIEDREVADSLAKIYRKKGMEILVNAKVTGVKRSSDQVIVNVDSEGETKTIEGDLALVAIGVQGNIENIGLETAGIELERGWIKADKTTYQTSVPGIYAIGDVIGPPWLAHVASVEAVKCVERIAGLNPQPIDYNIIPGCTYCQPQVASFGITEQRATEDGLDVKIGMYPFIASGKAQAVGESDGFVKLIFDAKSGKLLGAHILGADATEMIAELVLAGSFHATHKQILNAIHAHPTLSESVAEAAAAALNEAIHL
jgi:dihydrolipoamide dehydrogenase